MSKDEALRLALEALAFDGFTPEDATHRNLHDKAITAIKAALEAKDEPDWKDMYEKQKRRSEMWIAKYEKDIGPLEKAVPHQEAKDEPWVCECGADSYNACKCAIKSQPQRKPLMDEEILTYRYMIDWTADWSYIKFARAIEAAHGIKGEA